MNALLAALGEAMRRREFVTLLGGAAVTYPLAVRAQKSDQLRRVAVLGTTPALWGVWVAGFAERLRELGWIEEPRSSTAGRKDAQNASPKPRPISCGRNPTRSSPMAAQSRRSSRRRLQSRSFLPSRSIPSASDLVDNLSHPGGNVTGLSVQQNDTTGKRLELLHDIVPGLRRLAIMFDGGYRASIEENGQVQAMARTLGLEAAAHEIRRAEDIAPVFDALKGHADALYVVANALTASNDTPIVTLALHARSPTIFNSADFVRAGGLISYGADYPALFRRAADYVDNSARDQAWRSSRGAADQIRSRRQPQDGQGSGPHDSA